MSTVTLITGATGFIGRYLVKALKLQDRHIRCFVRRSSDTRFLEELGVELVYGDLLDPLTIPSALKDVDIIYHLAGVVYPRKTISYEANILMTENLLDASIGRGINKFIYLSSIAAAIGINSKIVDETSSCDPVTRYGRSKLEAERLLIDFAKETGLPIIIVRSPLVYGPYQNELSRAAMLFRLIKKKTFRIIGNGMNLISLCYIDNLIQGLLLVEKRGKLGEIYFIADERPYSLKEIAEVIAQEERVRLSKFHIPLWLASFAACILPHSLRKVIREMTSNWACDISKAKRELGYLPNIDLREGVKRTIDWYRAKVWGE